MKIEANLVNCIGYVYFRFGLQDNDQYLYPSTLGEIENDFEIVGDTEEFRDLVHLKEQVDAIAIIAYLVMPEPTLIHMAALDPDDKNFIIHRPKIGGEITREPLDGLRFYKDDPNQYGYSTYRLLRLKPKMADSL